MQVHVNGFVSLGKPPYPAWYPYLGRYWFFSRGFTVIAPFWADIDLRGTDGKVYLGHISRSSEWEYVTAQATEVYDAAKSLIVAGAGDTGFLPMEVVTVTWQNVSPYYYYYYYYYHGYYNAEQVGQHATDED